MNPLYAFFKRFAATSLAARTLPTILPKLDKMVLNWTGRRTTLSSLVTGVPIVILTCTGAKSGKKREVPLVGIPDGKGWILVASNWGGEKHPAWYYNVIANPHVTITHNQQTVPFVAVELLKLERERAWHKAIELYPGYRVYRERAGDRKIPVIRLRPEKEV